MIEFVSLLIGLVVGPRQVEMTVQGPVAVVEVALDGRLTHRITEEPWIVEVDFGARLVPHRLTATAFDGDGRAVDSTYQIVNYSRASFEAAIVLDEGEEKTVRTGRVIWRGALDEPPRRIALTFDNQPLEVDSGGGFVLPEHDPGALHVVESTVTFADGSTGIADLTFGGQFVDQTTTALTAVPLTASKKIDWRQERVGGWLEIEGQPAEVFTLSQPQGVAVVVRDHRLERATRSVLPWRDNALRRPFQSSGSLDYRVMAIGTRPLQTAPGTFRLTHPAKVDPRYGLRRILLHEGPLVPNKGVDGRKLVKKEQKLWDCLAVAGLNAARRNTPRVVVLMISDKLNDFGQLSALQAVDYLRSIHVPLLVWAPAEKHLSSFGLNGVDRSYLGVTGLGELEADLGRMLASQIIVWVKGERLPNEVSLSPAAPAEVELAR